MQYIIMEKPELKVYQPMKLDDPQRDFLHPLIPKPPFRMVFIGQTGCGKSNTIKNMLFSNGWYKNYFDQIYIWCGSRDDCEEYEILADMKKYKVWNEKKEEYYKRKTEYMSEKTSVSQGVDVDDLEELFESLEQNPEMEDDSTLFVFDDMIVNALLQSRGRFNVLDEAFIRGRHIGKGISLILSTQKYRALSQNMRTTNTSHLVIYYGLSKLDLDAISQENCGILSPNAFQKLFHDHVNKKYSFMIISQRSAPHEMFQNDKLEYIDIEPYRNIR